MSKHYDVAVLGAGAGALVTAALLARRSWRVLVLGQGWRAPTYAYDGAILARRPFTFLASSSPAWSRVLVELAQSQTFRRRVLPLDPMFQILAPRLRLDVPPDVQLFAKEIDRAYPEVRRVVDDLYANLAEANAAADVAFGKDLVWPPGSFWERRETGRTAGLLPRFDSGRSPPLLAEFPRDHDYRAIVDVPARFASHAVDLPDFAVARLHGAWTRGVGRLAQGEDELVDFLVERVRAHGGEASLGERASRVVHKRGRAAGIVIDGDEETTGVGFVVTDHPTRALLDLASDFDPPRRAMAALPLLVPAEWRFVMSLVVRDEGLPAALSDEAFLLPAWPQRGLDPSTPLVHLQRQRAGCGIPGATLLVAEAAFPQGSPLALDRAREAVLSAIESLLPFVESHYLIVDSPNDGRPLWDFRSGKRADVDRASLRATGGSLDAEPMANRWHVEEPGFQGLSAEPLRTPLDGAFVVGPSTLPSLGLEGELLAAWSVARMITRTDRQREKMRREMWSKIELG
ncbi:MAG TPA: NAD(P)-binding protein [Polyangiaceae bacterium]|jgi:phytoene dehydrogenase-like protein